MIALGMINKQRTTRCVFYPKLLTEIYNTDELIIIELYIVFGINVIRKPVLYKYQPVK